jgi:hypothetical protein
MLKRTLMQLCSHFIWVLIFGAIMNRNDFPLKDLVKTWIFDLDGTLVVHNGYKEGVDTLLPGVKEFYEKNITKDDYILIVTARFSKFKGIAEKCLLDNDIYYDRIIYDTPRGERILINDRKPWDGGLDTAFSYNIDRNEGLGNI